MHQETTNDLAGHHPEHIKLPPESGLRRKLLRAERKIEILEALIQEQAFQAAHSEAVTRDLDPGREGSTVRWSFMQELLDQSNESIIAIDPVSGLIIEANQGACRNLGYSAQEIRQLAVTDIEAMLPDEFQWATHALHLKAAGSMAMEGSHRRSDGSTFPVEVHIRYVDRGDREYVLAVARDISQRKETEVFLRNAQVALMDASRKAGMADVASSILHNIGNVLNGLTVGFARIKESFRTSELATLSAARRILEPELDDMEHFLRSDPKAAKLVSLVVRAIIQLEQERQMRHDYIDECVEHLGHIKSIIDTQQSHVRAAGVSEVVCLEEVIEDALRMSICSPGSRGDEFDLRKNYEQMAKVVLDRNRTLEIIVNLLSNARYAVLKQAGPRTISIETWLEGGNVCIRISDSGVGIAHEHRDRIFSQGFTTKPQGHGYGLHSAANAAQQMNGELSFESEGSGCGAAFTLKVPVKEVGSK